MSHPGAKHTRCKPNLTSGKRLLWYFWRRNARSSEKTRLNSAVITSMPLWVVYTQGYVVNSAVIKKISHTENISTMKIALMAVVLVTITSRKIMSCRALFLFSSLRGRSVKPCRTISSSILSCSVSSKLCTAVALK